MFKLSRTGFIALILLLILVAATPTASAGTDYSDSAIPEFDEIRIKLILEELDVSDLDGDLDIEEYILEADYLTPELLSLYREHLLETMKVETVSYVVQRGDTLTAIARQYNVSIETISASNDIKDPNRIFTGQELKFPTVDGLLYTVGEGETLADVADKFGVLARDIFYASGGLGATLEAGTKLVVPGGKLPVQQPTQIVASRSANVSHLVPAFVWPLQGQITSMFGSRGGTHMGLDIAKHTGAPIVAAAAGTVEYSGWLGSYGRLVLIRHDDKVITAYAHASKLLVSKGDYVEQGQEIARVGATGNATGPHLHFEVRINGFKYDPLPLLRR